MTAGRGPGGGVEGGNHGWFLDGLDRLDAVIRDTDTPESLMADVLDAALAAFECDRAWLLAPGDGSRDPGQVLVERTRSLSPRFLDRASLPPAAEIDGLVDEATAASGPFRLARPGAWDARSAAAVKVRPRTQKVLLLCIARVGDIGSEILSSPLHAPLLTELARRLGEALTTLVSVRDLGDARRTMDAAEHIAQFGCWERDFTTDVIRISQHLGELLGVTETTATLERWRVIWASLVHPDDYDRVHQTLRNAVAQGHPYDVVYRLARPQGGLRIIHSRGVVTLDEARQPRRMFGIMQDVTAQKELEDQLRHAQKMEAIGRLAGGVAHDFNNLLTIINGYCDMALTTLPDGDVNRKAMTEIRRAGERAASLTRQLLAFSRRQLLHPRVVNVNELLAGISKLLHPLIGDNVVLKVIAAPDLFLVKVDPAQFEQAIMNLATNARDAMPKGGHLTIETRNFVVDEAQAQTRSGLRAGQYAQIVIRDGGQGMDAATLVQAFEPFFTTKPLGQGTGLGLSMVYGFVKQSGGHVEVESMPGRGTTLTLYLPRTEETPLLPPAAETEANASRGRETILLVEDESALRRLCAIALEASGYRVIQACDGVDALERLERLEQHAQPLDAVVTDVVMPRMEGTALVERLRQRYVHLPVIFMSGYADEAILSGDPQSTASRFIAKPFTPTALVAKLRELLDSSAQPISC